MNEILDTGERAFWHPSRRDQLGRCGSCERHPATQGHHEFCPKAADNERNTP